MLLEPYEIEPAGSMGADSESFGVESSEDVIECKQLSRPDWKRVRLESQRAAFINRGFKWSKYKAAEQTGSA